jgi:hypothetical protein
MVRMFVRHTVRDYRAWRRVYDAFRGEQRRMGVRRQAVFRSTDNPNDITVAHDFQSLRAARAFVRSRELKEAMQDAGVRSRPAIWFVKEA